MTDEKILNYTTSGDLASLKKFAVQLKQSVHSYLPDGRTYLIAACTNGHHDVAEYLIDVHDADVLQVGTVDLDGEVMEGVPPLWCAAASGNLKLVELLVSRGADVNQTTPMNSTALRAACFGGHEEVVKYLIEHGADVEIPNCHGHTSLMISCYRRHDRIVKYLLEKNARVNRQSHKGSTALHECAEIGYIRGLQLLFEYGAKMYIDENGQSPIICAANAGSKKTVEYLAGLSKCALKRTCATPTISAKEKSIAYELLGASLFDRHHSIPDAISAWNHALILRQVASNPTEEISLPDSSSKFINPEEFRSSKNIWSKLYPAAHQAVERMESRVGYSQLDSQAHCTICLTEFAGDSSVSASTVPEQCSGSSFAVYRQKYDKLQADLFSAYISEVQRMHCNKDTTRVRQEGHEIMNTFNCSTAMDPILGLEPLLESSSANGRWSFDHTSSHSLCSQLQTGKKRANFKRCVSCEHVLVPLGMAPNITRCPSCRRILSTSDNFTLCPYKRKPMASFLKDGKVTHQAKHPRCRNTTKKHPLIERFKTYTVDAFNRVREFSTPEQLDDLSRDPQALCLQPLLIRLRILGPGHPEINRFIRDAIYADTNNLRQCLKLWRYVITYQHLFSNPLGPTSQTSFASLAELFFNILTESCSAIPAADLDPALVVDCFELAVDNLKWAMEYSLCHLHTRCPWSFTSKDKDSIDLTRNATLCLNLIAMILTYYSPKSNYLPNPHAHSQILRPSKPVSKPSPQVLLDELITDQIPLGPMNPHLSFLSPSSSRSSFDSVESLNRFEGQMSPELCDRFYSQVYRLVKLNPQLNHGLSLVHLACSPESTTVGRFEMCQFPRVDVLNLLLQLGANPNLPDIRGQRPVVYVLSHPHLNTDDRIALLETLVYGGAHLDVSNPTGISILDIRCRTLVQESKICLLNHMTLACLAARTAKNYGLTSAHPFVQTHLPHDLIKFIEMH